jgi:hypothetical protein
MKTTETATGIPTQIRIELQQTLADIANGVRDLEKMKAAAERMDRMRERNRELFGNLTSASRLSVRCATADKLRDRHICGFQMGDC